MRSFGGAGVASQLSTTARPLPTTAGRSAIVDGQAASSRAT